MFTIKNHCGYHDDQGAKQQGAADGAAAQEKPMLRMTTGWGPLSYDTNLIMVNYSNGQP